MTKKQPVVVDMVVVDIFSPAPVVTMAATVVFTMSVTLSVILAAIVGGAGVIAVRLTTVST